MAVEDSDPEGLDPVVGPSKPRLLQVLGPGLITGASDDDPSGISTYSQAGAQFGYGLTWTMLFSYPLMAAVQMISARIGRTTGHGIAGVLRLHYPGWLLQSVVALLLVANTINLGADLGAMADAVYLLLPGPRWLYILLFAGVCLYMQVFLQYTRYVAVLKWLTLALFAYFAALVTTHVDWSQLLRGLLVPKLTWSPDDLTTIVAVFGTTISPYLFFWQSSQEAEEIASSPKQKSIRSAPRGATKQFRRMRFDTLAGMAFSNLIAIAIMLATAATLNRQGIVQIDSAAQAAEALRPVAGSFAFALFAIGIIGTGFLAVPVLAGSGAFAVAEVFGWREGLEYQPKQAAGFYSIIVAATMIGVLLDWSSIDPIRALFWSAVLNGLAAVPLMIAMMIVVSRHKVMGRFTASRPLLLLGWAATAVMALAAMAMLVTSFP